MAITAYISLGDVLWLSSCNWRMMLVQLLELLVCFSYSYPPMFNPIFPTRIERMQSLVATPCNIHRRYVSFARG